MPGRRPYTHQDGLRQVRLLQRGRVAGLHDSAHAPPQGFVRHHDSKVGEWRHHRVRRKRRIAAHLLQLLQCEPRPRSGSEQHRLLRDERREQRRARLLVAEGQAGEVHGHAQAEPHRVLRHVLQQGGPLLVARFGGLRVRVLQRRLRHDRPDDRGEGDGEARDGRVVHRALQVDHLRRCDVRGGGGRRRTIPRGHAGPGQCHGEGQGGYGRLARDERGHAERQRPAARHLFV